MTPSRRTRRHARGYTTIEVAAVVAIVGILMTVTGVAVTYARNDTVERQAEQAAFQVVSAQLAFADRYGTFTSWPADLDLPEGPEVRNGVVTEPRMVSIAMGADGTVGIATGDGRSVCVLRTLRPLLAGGGVTGRSASMSGQGCDGASALPPSAELTSPVSRVP